MVKLLGLLTLCGLIAVSDIRTLTIPNRYNGLLFCWGLFCRGWAFPAVESGVLGAGLYTIPLILLHGYGSDLLGRETVGFGDIKLVLNFGYILGFRAFIDVYYFYLFSFVSGALVSLVCLYYKKREVPFAPFLILSFFALFLNS